MSFMYKILKINIFIILTNWILIVIQLFIKTICNFISSKKAFRPKSMWSPYGSGIIFSALLMPVFTFYLCEFLAKLVSSMCTQWSIDGLHCRFIRPFLMSKCCVRQFERVHSLDILYSCHMKLRYFLQFV